jgi:hypothetical protein
MNRGDLRQIVPGITISGAGQASVAPALTEVLLDLANELEEPTDLPVDVEHVLAAIVLAAGDGELAPDVTLQSNDPQLIRMLAPHVVSVFRDYGGQVGHDD